MTSETRTDQIYHQIRSDILAGSFKPNSRLQFSQLNESYGASVGVLREALNRLSSEGLTTNTSQQGFRVMSLSRDDLVDLTEARCHIESLIVETAVKHGDLDWEGRVLAAHHRMERTPKRNHGEDTMSGNWTQTHHDFHLALCSGATNRRLLTIASTLRASAEVYRRWSLPFEVKSERDVDAEHRKLLELALARDSKGTARALTDHLRKTEEILLASWDDIHR